MVHSITNRVVGRAAALLFLAGGSVSAITAFLPIQEQANRPAEFAVGLAAIAVGLGAWFAPWHRWPRGRSLWLTVLAFAMLGATVVTGSSDNATYAAYFIVISVWVGIGHPRWTTARLLPLAVVAYVLPLVAVGETAGALDSVLEVAVLCLVIGEALAWVSERLRTAEVLDERRSYQMQMLLRAGELLARENEPARLPALAAELAVQLLRSQAALILLADGDRMLRTVGAFRWPDAPPDLSIGAAPALGRIMDDDRVTRLDPETARREAGLTSPFPQVLTLPLAGTIRPQGLLLVGVGDRSLPVDDFGQDMARTFATQAGLALERLNAAQALLEETLRDELTGLGNRRYANVALADSMPGDALVVIDLDRFKQLNDTRGHAAGDDMLRMLAAHLRSALREHDTAARMGGDEFLLILRGVGDNASATVQRLEQQWRAAELAITYSAGIAMRVAGESPERTLARADAALYMAKENGRDRVSIAS